MAEQKAVAKYLLRHEAIDKYLASFKSELEYRLQNIYQGIIQLKKEGHSVDAIAPQAAIYLTLQFDLIGRKTVNGDVLNAQEEVTQYILSEAKLAIVPFYAFGAPRSSTWYRLSVGNCKKEEIAAMLDYLRAALSKLK